MNLIDLLVIVLIGLFVVTRFTKFKLPKDLRDKASRSQDWRSLRRGLMPGEEHPPEAEPKVVGASAVPAPKPKKSPKELAKGLDGMAKVKALEPDFSEKEFVDGAAGAYRYFYDCWNRKDESGLDDLFAPVLLNRLLARWQGGGWHGVTVDSVDEVVIAGARVHGRTAIIDVDFKATHREGSGGPRSVRSRWVLARALNSDDPNWELQDMKTGTDA